MLLEGEGRISKWGTKGAQGVGGHGSTGQPDPDRCGTVRHVSDQHDNPLRLLTVSGETLGGGSQEVAVRISFHGTSQYGYHSAQLDRRGCLLGSTDSCGCHCGISLVEMSGSRNLARNRQFDSATQEWIVVVSE